MHNDVRQATVIRLDNNMGFVGVLGYCWRSTRLLHNGGNLLWAAVTIGLSIASATGFVGADLEASIMTTYAMIIAAAVLGGLVLEFAAFVLGSVNIRRAMNGEEISSFISALFYLTRVTQIGWLVYVIIMTVVAELWLFTAITLFATAWINIFFLNKRSAGTIWFSWTSIVLLLTGVAQLIVQITIWAG